MMLAITITTAAITITIGSSRTNTALSLGEVARSNAEAGVENALEVLLRNPSYTVTSSVMNMTNGTVTITVSGTTTKTIVAIGTDASFTRTITATANYVSNAYALASWSETP